LLIKLDYSSSNIWLDSLFWHCCNYSWETYPTCLRGLSGCHLSHAVGAVGCSSTCKYSTQTLSTFTDILWKHPCNPIKK